jgi:hypothetical protein
MGEEEKYMILRAQDIIAIRLYLEYRKEILEREIHRFSLWKKKDLNPPLLRVVSKKKFRLADYSAEIGHLSYLEKMNTEALLDLLNPVMIDTHYQRRVDRIEKLLEEFIVSCFPILNTSSNLLVPEIEITKVEKLRALEEAYAAAESLRSINPKKADAFEKKLSQLQVTFIPESVAV